MAPDIDLENVDIKSISEAQLPGVVRSQCEILTELDQKLETAFQKAYGAQRSANVASTVKVGRVFGKRKAIQASQQALADLADANAANTEAVKVVFEYQKQIANIMNWFISLGTMSLAMNRATINQLQAILKEGTSARLSDATKAELKNVIRNLKSQEDFMQKQAKTETAVKGHEKRLSKVEKRQKFLFGGMILALLLIVVVGVAASRANIFASDQASAEAILPVPSEPAEIEDPTTSPVSAPPEPTEDPIEGQQAISTDSTIQTVEESALPVPSSTPGSNSVVLPVESTLPQASETPEVTSIPQGMDLASLTGMWYLRSYAAYINIFEVANKYYIAFAVPNGGFTHYLPQPAELTVDGAFAVASYSADNEGNHGTIRIQLSDDASPLITATMNDSSTPIYSSTTDDMLYLIVTDAPMYSDPDMKDYPVYKEYLDPNLFGNLIG